MRYNGNNTKGKYTHHENQIQIYWKENIQDRVTREISQTGDFSSTQSLTNGKSPINYHQSAPWRGYINCRGPKRGASLGSWTSSSQYGYDMTMRPYCIIFCKCNR